MSKAILVTGGSGFIGRHVVRELESREHTVLAPTRREMDCLDSRQVARYVGGHECDTVVHLACNVPRYTYTDEALQERAIDNVAMTAHVLHAARAQQRRALFVYASSTSVYGYRTSERVLTESTRPTPETAYSVGKLLGEALCSLYLKQCCVLRISSPYGEGMQPSVLRRFTEQALSGETVSVWGSGERMQDFTYVKDVARGIALVVENKATGVYNLSSGVGTSMKTLADTIVRLADSRSKVVVGAVADPQDDYRMRASYKALRVATMYEPQYRLESGGLRAYIGSLKKQAGNHDDR